MSDELTIDDGGPAFPSVETHPTCGTRNYFGLSVLDYFAAQALAGLMTSEPVRDHWTEFEIAGFCYEQAIAMLNAREAIHAHLGKSGGAK